MKKVHFLSLIILSLFILYPCTSTAQNISDKTDSPAKGLAFKGYELYSWKDHDEWKFSLLMGTNRNKSKEEIKDPDVTINSVESLKNILSKLPENESVFWTSSEGLTPPKIIEEIESFSKLHKIKLYSPE